MIIKPVPTLDALVERMRDEGAALVFHAEVPGGQNNRLNIPAEIAVFTGPDIAGGCMVWGRGDLGWHPNHGERSAVSILLAKVKEQA